MGEFPVTVRVMVYTGYYVELDCKLDWTPEEGDIIEFPGGFSLPKIGLFGDEVEQPECAYVMNRVFDTAGILKTVYCGTVTEPKPYNAEEVVAKIAEAKNRAADSLFGSMEQIFGPVGNDDGGQKITVH